MTRPMTLTPVGTKSGKWTIIDGSQYYKGSLRYAPAVCECGTTKDIVMRTVTKSASKCCFQCARSDRKKTDTGIRQEFLKLRNRANYINVPFNLSIDIFMEIVTSNCHYCNKHPERSVRDNMVNGIDRKDNNRGYEIDNCVPCCWLCNRLKYDMLYNEFLYHCARIAKHRGYIDKIR